MHMQALHALWSNWSSRPTRHTRPGRSPRPPRLARTRRHPWARVLPAAAVVTLALVGTALSPTLSPTAQADEPSPDPQVTVPGSHNDEMGCAEIGRAHV